MKQLASKEHLDGIELAQGCDVRIVGKSAPCREGRAEVGWASYDAL